MTRIYNFSAGPAVLPEPVLERAQKALWDVRDSGIGVLEHSHRGSVFKKIQDEAEANLRKLANISDDYAVLFLQGGASTQFFMAPMNWLNGDTADYLNTGAWSQKAIAEAKRFGTVHVAASSEDKNFNYIPQKIEWSKSPRFAHFTSNNTIFGTEFRSEPTVPRNVPLLCDASSDVFSRPVDISKYALLYAGAQKNLGPSGLTLVVVKKSWAETGSRDLPPMLQYRTHIADESAYNTPPTFAIYIVGEVAKWMLDQGGLEAIEAQNRKKAARIYDFLDNSKLFYGTAEKDSRSLMNITFRARDEKLENKVIAAADACGLSGLKGHRSVGGMRASIYNAFPLAGCNALVEFLHKFETENTRG